MCNVQPIYISNAYNDEYYDSKEAEPNNFSTNISRERNSEWLSGWQYRKFHIIRGAPNAGTDYRVQIKVYFQKGADNKDEVYLGRNDNWVSQWKISINSSKHNDYGLAYPVTFAFSLPENVTSTKVYYRYNQTSSWNFLATKTENDFFNGINCVRFSYTNHMAYVSIAFSSGSDKIYLKFTDTDDNEIPVNFAYIPKYYDNRACGVVYSIDDFSGGSTDISVLDLFQSRNIWATIGIVTNWVSDWSIIQTLLDQGYCEVASHSKSHPQIPYGDPDYEINRSKNDIIDNLELPSFYKKGTKEYVPAYLEPYSKIGHSERQKLADCKYLIDRFHGSDYRISDWDDDTGTFHRERPTKNIDYLNTSEMNSYFNIAYNNGGLYHAYIHPHVVRKGMLSSHLDYVKDRKDVWYVGLGALYMYQYVRFFAKLEPQTTAQCRPDFSDIRFTKNDGTTLLPYFIEEKVDRLYAYFWVLIPDDLSTNQTIYIYYGNFSATSQDNGFKTKIVELRSHATTAKNVDFCYSIYDNGTAKWLRLEDSSSHTKGKAYAFIVVPQNWINGKYLQWRWQGYYNSTSDATVAQVKIYDGAYYHYQILDFPFQNNELKTKGAGCLQTYNKTIHGTWSETTEMQVSLSSAQNNYVTLFFVAIDNWTDQQPRVDINWIKVNTGLNGSGNVATINFSENVDVQGAGNGRYTKEGYYRKVSNPEPSHGAWGIEENQTTLIHNIAITHVTTLKKIIGEGYNLGINITITNTGGFIEIFDVNIHANTTSIGVITNITLTSMSRTTLTFLWNTTSWAKGSYTISAHATQVVNETDLSDNSFTDGEVYVGCFCDVDANGKVEAKDIALIISAYRKTYKSPGWYEPYWYANYDVDCDGKVEAIDIAYAIANYGHTGC